MSPGRTTTAPPACFASLPVSNEISSRDLHGHPGDGVTTHVSTFLSAFGAEFAGLSCLRTSLDPTRSGGRSARRRARRAKTCRRRSASASPPLARPGCRPASARARAPSTSSQRRSRSKRSISRPSAPRVRPQMRVVGVGGIREQRVVELPDNAPAPACLSTRSRQRHRARVLGGDREVAKGDRAAALRSAARARARSADRRSRRRAGPAARTVRRARGRGRRAPAPARRQGRSRRHAKRE